MDKTLLRVTDFQQQRFETYRYWQGRSVAERLEAVAEIVRDAYLAKGVDVEAQPMDKTLLRFERTRRDAK